MVSLMHIIRIEEEDASGRWQAGVRPLEFDTKLFGFGVAALDPFVSGKLDAIGPFSTAGKSVVEKCLAAAREAGVKQISATVSPEDSAGQSVLSQCGFNLADTILSFRLDLENKDFSKENSSSVREGTEEDIEAVSAISAECFSNRAYNVNRFNSDPIFPPDKVRVLYATWARNSFNGEAADKVFVYEESGQVVGFITCRIPTASQRAEGVFLGTIPLNAVHPNFQGRGIYKKLVKESLSWLSQNGAKTAEIRTQITNSAVHRTWENLGGHLYFAYHRFHRSL